MLEYECDGEESYEDVRLNELIHLVKTFQKMPVETSPKKYYLSNVDKNSLSYVKKNIWNID
jgi:hypothetical protein